MAAVAAEICGSVAAGKNVDFSNILFAFLHVLSISGRFVGFLNDLEIWTFCSFQLSASFS